MKKEITHAQIHEFNKLYYKIMGLYVRLDNELRINAYLYKVLHGLVVSDLHTQKDIAQRYEMPKQTINNVILSLQKEGFIKIVISPNDKREKLINLTQSGAKYAQEFITKYTDFEQKIYQRLGAKKFEKLTEFFSDFEVAFSEVLSEIQTQIAQDSHGYLARIVQNKQTQNQHNGGAK